MFWNHCVNKTIIILGDMLTLLVVTLIGFATHGESNLSFLPRMLTTFIPLLIAWFLLAPWFGLFATPSVPAGHFPRNRGGWMGVVTAGVAMLFAGPLAVVLRGLILNAPIIPIFAVVLSITSALGMMIWRTVYLILNHKLSERD
jgi:flagellar biosynthesis protein FliQ